VDCDDVGVEDDDEDEDEPGPDVREEVLEPVLVAMVEDDEEDDDPRPELLALEVVDLVDEEEDPLPVEEEDDVVGLVDEDEPLPVEELLPEDEVLLVLVVELPLLLDPDDE
jgi:hypothetical protein